MAMIYAPDLWTENESSNKVEVRHTRIPGAQYYEGKSHIAHFIYKVGEGIIPHLLICKVKQLFLGI
jgi:hypothetical protein